LIDAKDLNLQSRLRAAFAFATAVLSVWQIEPNLDFWGHHEAVWQNEPNVASARAG